MTSCPHSMRAVLSSTPRRVGSIPLGLSCCPGKELRSIRRSGSSPLHSWAPDQYGLRRRDHDGPEQPEGGREGPSLWVCFPVQEEKYRRTTENKRDHHPSEHHDGPEGGPECPSGPPLWVEAHTGTDRKHFSYFCCSALVNQLQTIFVALEILFRCHHSFKLVSTF
jgi:hypothetical protein